MENHNEPDAIREKLAEIAGNCIERRLERRALALLVAAKVRDYGDTAARNGNLIDAARYHQRALALMGEAASAALEALEICRDFGIEAPDEITGAAWIATTEHRGVGEGDEGLPGRVLDRVKLQDLTADELDELKLGISQSTDCQLTAPLSGGGFWKLSNEEGDSVALSGGLTCADVHFIATRAENGLHLPEEQEAWSKIKPQLAMSERWLNAMDHKGDAKKKPGGMPPEGRKTLLELVGVENPAPCGCEKSPAEPEPEPEPEYIDPADLDPRPPVHCR